MNQHLRVTLDPLVELDIGIWCLVDGHFVGDHKRRFCFAGDDQIAEVAIVGLDIALSSSQMQTLRTSV